MPQPRYVNSVRRPEARMLEAGQLIDQRYAVQRMLGSGAMASVYEVKHVTLHSRHAVKILNAELARSADLRNRFLSEGRIQAQLRHPNIVAVTDIVTDPAPGLVMELLEGGTLADLLTRDGPATSPEAAMALFLPVLEAVSVAHDAGVIHRDLKPENILMGTDRRGRLRPAVADFGIARVLDGARIEGNKHATEAGVRMGTVLYMSPEQVEGRAVDARSDVFALGAILFEILTGQTAFAAPSQYATMKRIVEGDLPLRAVGGLHPGIAACIRRALAVDPAERFQSCDALHDALVGVLEGSGPLPSRPSRSKAVTIVPEPDLAPEPPPLPASLLSASPPPLPTPPPLQPRESLTWAPAPEASSTAPAVARVEPEVTRSSWEVATRGRAPTPVLPEPVAYGPPAYPGWSALMSLTILLTGVGQMMNGQVGKGLLVLSLHWTLALITCGASLPISAVVAALDAWLVGQKLRRGEVVASWEWF